MAQTKAETLMASYAGMTPAERLEFRAMLAGYALRDQPATTGKKTPAKKSTPAKAAEEAKA